MASIIPYSNGNTSVTPFDSWFNAFNNVFGITPSDLAPASMQMDVEDKPNEYDVSVTVPGVKRDQIDVELDRNNLVITVDKKDSEEDHKKNYLRRETSEYHATKSVYLKDADAKGIQASLSDGVLTVVVPKKAENTGTKVEIQ